MTKVKMTAPSGVTSISIEGVQISVVDGFAMVDAAHTNVAQSHGFMLPYAPAIDVSRTDLVHQITSSFRMVAETLSNETLRSFLSADDARKVDVWESFRESIGALAQPVETKPAETKPAETKPAEPTKK